MIIVIGEPIVPKGTTYEGTTVGGLSGIDRDPRTGEYVGSDGKVYQVTNLVADEPLAKTWKDLLLH